MRELEVFFDYACPYCYKGHYILKELLKEFGDIKVIWRPVEAHPRPERYGKHSDLAIAAYKHAAHNGADTDLFHEKMYDAFHKDSVNVEDAEELSKYLDGVVDVMGLKESLLTGENIPFVNESNNYAYDKSDVWVVPAYRMGGRRLDVKENVGVNKDMLREFLSA